VKRLLGLVLGGHVSRSLWDSRRERVGWNYESKDYGFSEELGMLYFLREGSRDRRG